MSPFSYSYPLFIHSFIFLLAFLEVFYFFQESVFAFVILPTIFLFSILFIYCDNVYYSFSSQIWGLFSKMFFYIFCVNT